MQKPSCKSCSHSSHVINLPSAHLICVYKPVPDTPFHAVAPTDSCPHFHPADPAPSVRFIPLTMNKFAVVDSADYPSLARYKWTAAKAANTFYAVRSQNRKQIRMHRQILNAPANLFVDHIDHNGLNNTRKNLRLATRAQNSRNARPQKNKTSKYKGVCFHKRDKKYHARIYRNGKTTHIGCFKNEKDAAKAYDKKAKKLFGNFACLNLPDD